MGINPLGHLKCGNAPIFGCILIGGKSSRMGRPKQLLQEDGQSWLERSAALMREVCVQVVLGGCGQVPEALSAMPQIPDIPGLAGPLAGLLAVMRWQPEASWLLLGCDQPCVSREALSWLLEQRRPGIRALLPTLDGLRIEPLLAYYDRRARQDLEGLAAQGCLRLGRLAGIHGIASPLVPEGLQSAWSNINTPQQLEDLHAAVQGGAREEWEHNG